MAFSENSTECCLALHGEVVLLSMPASGVLVHLHAFAWELVKTFLQAEFSGADRFQHRLTKVAALENSAKG